MKNTKIEWAHHTVNFWWGCSFARYLHSDDVREECLHCYALTLAKLFSKGKATWGPAGNRWLRHHKAMAEINRLDESAARRGVRERVFINSMSDTFEDRADLNEARTLLWIAAHAVTNLDLLLLTKRPGNVAQMVPAHWMAGAWPSHVWIGTTAGTQRAADENIPPLLSIPAKVRFLSCEPLLGPVDLCKAGAIWSDMNNNPIDGRGLTQGIHWVIAGGESGPKARPMHPDWARSLRDQCAAAGVAFHFKQWGEFRPAATIEEATNYPVLVAGPDNRSTVMSGCHHGDHQVAAYIDGAEYSRAQCAMVRAGKAAAGRLLDGREHNEVPQ